MSVLLEGLTNLRDGHGLTRQEWVEMFSELRQLEAAAARAKDSTAALEAIARTLSKAPSAPKVHP